METTNKLEYKHKRIYTEDGEKLKMVVKISLDDNCKNKICDWSITADIYYESSKHWIFYKGGCCHEEIEKVFPELAKFIPLHLSNHYGASLYPTDNGIYHMKNSGKKVAMDYLRISEEEYNELSKMVDDKLFFKYLLFDLGIVARWKKESDELIAELEQLCNKKWVNPYKPEEEKFKLVLTKEERDLIEQRISDGYYSIENINKRKEEAEREKINKRYGEICEEYDKKIEDLKKEKNVFLSLLDCGIAGDNIIYYEGSNKLVFNWLGYKDKITREEFDYFVNNCDKSKLPEGIEFEFKDIR